VHIHGTHFMTNLLTILPWAVTDRLAYFQFVQGSLSASLAEKLDASRLPLKNLRDKEDALNTRRNTRTNYEQQIAKLELSSGNERKINELEDLLQRANVDDEPLEKEVQLLERKAIKDSEQAKWEAIREVNPSFWSATSGKLTNRYSTARSW